MAGPEILEQGPKHFLMRLPKHFSLRLGAKNSSRPPEILHKCHETDLE